MSDLQLEIKNLIIDALGLEDMAAEDIAADLTLFGEGLGLDSVDALELGLAIQKRFGIKIDAEAKDTRKHFANVASLAAFVSSQQPAGGSRRCKPVKRFSTPCVTRWSSCSSWTPNVLRRKPTSIRTLRSIASMQWT